MKRKSEERKIRWVREDIRRDWERAEKRKQRIELAILVALTLGFFAFLIVWNYFAPFREMTAYFEGYFGSKTTATNIVERMTRRDCQMMLARIERGNRKEVAE